MKKVIRILLVGVFALFTLIFTGSVRKSPNRNELPTSSAILKSTAQELPSEHREGWQHISLHNPEAILLVISE